MMNVPYQICERRAGDITIIAYANADKAERELTEGRYNFRRSFTNNLAVAEIFGKSEIKYWWWKQEEILLIHLFFNLKIKLNFSKFKILNLFINENPKK